MDVNATKFHLRNERDWLRLLIEQNVIELWWDSSRQFLTLAPKILQNPLQTDDQPLKPDNRRGADNDRYGNLYWISDDKKRILCHPYATPAETGTFWSVDDLKKTCSNASHKGEFKPVEAETVIHPPKLSGLVVTQYHYLAAGTLEPAGLLIFDLHAGGPPVWLRWPVDVPFAPFDMASAPDGGIWILDRDQSAGGARFWRLDRYFRVVPTRGEYLELEPGKPADFRAIGDQAADHPAKVFPSGISIELTSPVEAHDPISITGLSNRSVLILDLPDGPSPSIIQYYRDGQKMDEVSLDHYIIGSLLDKPVIRGHDFAFVSKEKGSDDVVRGSLFVASVNGRQTFMFKLKAGESELILSLEPPFFPMSNFTGKALVDKNSEIYYDSDQKWLPLVEQPRRRYISEASFDGNIFDGKEPDCIWHRLLLDACIPDGTAIMIRSRSANQLDLLTDIDWYNEPPLYLRGEGPEIPLHQPFSKDELNQTGTGTWELLFQNAKGRLLELQLSLIGTGRASPGIRALRVYYARFSYLEQYLPAVYRDDADSAHFLDRFLANVEGLYTTLEGRIERAESLFDTRTAPPEYQEWLAGWLGTVLDPTWDDERRRLFLDHAELLFRWRGTQVGMRAAIRLSIDPCPDEHIFDELRDEKEYRPGTLGGSSVRIAENFLYRQYPGVAIGDPTEAPVLGLEPEDTPWEPAHGSAPIHKKFQDFLRALYHDDRGDDAILKRINDEWEKGDEKYDSFEMIRFLPLPPSQPVMLRDWLLFIRERIGFTYETVNLEDRELFREFLARRYRTINNLNNNYGLEDEKAYKQFSDIPLPVEMPNSGSPLFDWIDFVSRALPIKRNAHSFTVLVPTELGELPYARKQRKAHVEEIVKREKPAHTNFEVKLYWALFMVGSARLGLDSIIGEGSRFVALVLGANYLGQSYLSASHPWNVSGRTVTGRDRLGEGHVWRSEE